MITTSALSELKYHDKVDIHLIIQHQSFFVNAVGDLFQEEPKAVQLLVSTVESLFISGLNYYHHTHTGKTDIYTMTKSFGRVKISANMVENMENGYLLMKGGGALAEIFGNKLGQALNYLVKRSGVKASTAYTYTCLYATVVLKSLGEQVMNADMSAASFIDYLESSELGISKKEMTILLEENIEAGQPGYGDNIDIAEEGITEETGNELVKKVVSFVLLIVLAVSLYFIYKNRHFEPQKSLPGSVQQVKLIGISGT